MLKTASLGRYQTQSAVPADFQLTNGYGLGFMVMHRDNYVAFGHPGAVAGYQAALDMNREASVGVIVLANTLGSEALDSNSLALKSLDLLAK